jgi:outer membrane protein assembly factor BamB
VLCLLTLGAIAVPVSTSYAATPSRAAHVGAGGETGWPQPGYGYDNSRHVRGSSIRSSTVGRLSLQWQIGTPGALTTAVLVVGGFAYAEDDTGVVIKADEHTGQIAWRSAPSGFDVGPEGVAIGSGRVYATTPDGVQALGIETGTTLWRVRLTTSETAGVDIQPTVIGSRVLVATVPVSVGVQYHGGDRGELYAVDAATGRVDWSFDTVASKDLWGNPEVNSGGGAWYPPAIDTKTGVVYWGTANPAPFPGTPQYPNGSSRPGRNLYTDSTVALSLASGRLLWYHQTVPHDLFDQDFVHTLLVTLPGPTRRQIVVGTGKGGQVVALDPVTGRRLWQTTVGKQENHSLKALTGPTEVLPGTFGGVLTPPASADGDVYVATLNAPTVLNPDKTAYFGGKIGTMDGELLAINGSTGKILWDTAVPGDPTGGATVVNDLVVTATFQGQIVAVSRKTGRLVWIHAVGAPVSGWLAIAGDLLVVPTGSVGTSGRLMGFGVG